MYSLFKDSPARRADYIALTGCHKFAKKFCQVRWVENVDIALRVLEIFYHVKKIIQSGRQFIGFDLDEIAIGETDYDANVGARVLWKMCNLLASGNKIPVTDKVEECATSM